MIDWILVISASYKGVVVRKSTAPPAKPAMSGAIQVDAARFSMAPMKPSSITSCNDDYINLPFSRRKAFL